MCKKQSYIILSIKPEFAYLILSGAKTVEFRKNFSSNLVDSKIILYATTPLQSIVGAVDILDIQTEEIKMLKQKYLTNARISSHKFDQYFGIRKTGVAIKLINPAKFTREIPLKMLRNYQIEAPNSHMIINSMKEPIFSFLHNHLQSC